MCRPIWCNPACNNNAWLVKNFSIFCLRINGWPQRSVWNTSGYSWLQSLTTTSRRSTRTSWRASSWGDAGRRPLMPSGPWVDSPLLDFALITRTQQAPSLLWARRVRTFEAPNRNFLGLYWKKRHFLAVHKKQFWKGSKWDFMQRHERQKQNRKRFPFRTKNVTRLKKPLYQLRNSVTHIPPQKKFFSNQFFHSVQAEKCSVNINCSKKCSKMF